jgi:hypothetical protein
MHTEQGSEAADLEEGLIAVQREYASEESSDLRDGVDVGAVYTWGYDRALDKGWTAIGPHKAGEELALG